MNGRGTRLLRSPLEVTEFRLGALPIKVAPDVLCSSQKVVLPSLDATKWDDYVETSLDPAIFRIEVEDTTLDPKTVLEVNVEIDFVGHDGTTARVPCSLGDATTKRIVLKRLPVEEDEEPKPIYVSQYLRVTGFNGAGDARSASPFKKMLIELPCPFATENGLTDMKDLNVLGIFLRAAYAGNVVDRIRVGNEVRQVPIHFTLVGVIDGERETVEKNTFRTIGLMNSIWSQAGIQFSHAGVIHQKWPTPNLITVGEMYGEPTIPKVKIDLEFKIADAPPQVKVGNQGDNAFTVLDPSTDIALPVHRLSIDCASGNGQAIAECIKRAIDTAKTIGGIEVSTSVYKVAPKRLMQPDIDATYVNPAGSYDIVITPSKVHKYIYIVGLKTDVHADIAAPPTAAFGAHDTFLSPPWAGTRHALRSLKKKGKHVDFLVSDELTSGPFKQWLCAAGRSGVPQDAIKDSVFKTQLAEQTTGGSPNSMWNYPQMDNGVANEYSWSIFGKRAHLIPGTNNVDTFPYEIGHALGAVGHVCATPNNLMISQLMLGGGGQYSIPQVMQAPFQVYHTSTNKINVTDIKFQDRCRERIDSIVPGAKTLPKFEGNPLVDKNEGGCYMNEACEFAKGLSKAGMGSAPSGRCQLCIRALGPHMPMNVFPGDQLDKHRCLAAVRKIKRTKDLRTVCNGNLLGLDNAQGLFPLETNAQKRDQMIRDQVNQVGRNF